MIELLAPVGNMEKLDYAIAYGADAVYFAGKQFGLRAFAGNFEDGDIALAVEKCHKNGKKAYVTVNIVARDNDFNGLEQYIKLLEKSKVDAVIVSDIGVIDFIRQCAPNLAIHVSTQANVLNSYSANFFAKMGVKRIVLARELSVEEIKNIRAKLDKDVELECFVHGAMCISYSGRCLLSNYLSKRDSNRGACVQACRWEYCISEKSRQNDKYEIQEDERGTYILNSKDLNMIKYIKDLADAGVVSFKIEGRMKSPYYVATVVNAYRRAIDEYYKNPNIQASDELYNELIKTSHRNFTTGFYFGSSDKECLTSSLPVSTHEFVATVCENAKDGKVLVEMRNRFKVGDKLEILSPDELFNKKITIEKMQSVNGQDIIDAKNVQEKLYIITPLQLKKYDILRVKTQENLA